MRILFLLLISSVGFAKVDFSNINPKSLPILTLKKPIRIFHWTHRDYTKLPQTGPVNPLDPEVANNIKDRIDRYWDEKLSPSGMSGNGLYAALDPAATVSYGGQNAKWVLYSIFVPAGTQILDTGSNKAVDPSLTELARKHNCNMYGYWNSVMNSTGKDCRWFLEDFAYEFGVQLVLYSYNSSPIRGCNAVNTPRQNAAFVITSYSAIDFSKTYAMVPESKDPLIATEMDFVKKYFWAVNATTGNDPNKLEFKESDPWSLTKGNKWGTYSSNLPTISAKKADYDNTVKWARENLFHCATDQELFQ